MHIPLETRRKEFHFREWRRQTLHLFDDFVCRAYYQNVALHIYAAYLYCQKSVASMMAKRSIETEIDINAPTAQVWALLTDFARMPSWNPFIKSISGNLAQGAQLSVHITPPGSSGMRFKPTILSVRPERELRWLGHLLVPGIFDGEHYFLLEPIGDTRTRLTQGEKFSGLLVGLFGSALAATSAGFKAMNTALKQQAEKV